MSENIFFQTVFAAVMEIDLDRIKFKLMHAESGEGWSQKKTDSVEKEYRRFLCLMKMYPDEDTSPLMDIDTFWHYHILDTMKYALDCEKVFGYFLHHYPYVGLRSGNDIQFRVDSGERMRVLYEMTFGEAYIKPEVTDAATQAAAFCAGPHAETAFCAGPHNSNQPVRVNADTAFCAGPHAELAFCAGPHGRALPATTDRTLDAATAFCAGPHVKTAFCAGPHIHTSPSHAHSGPNTAMAFCAGPHAQTAFCAGPHIEKRDLNNATIPKSGSN
ncbi:hypothetical protein HH212_01765 [Massilia forsythiae]|uniref:Glycine-rich domain-containing protein-like n=1 Tax=Massilia forsythiae TaxID=2728020 RepID=A0A7Z2ZQY9_9BURK|nr:hypothetical protein [Massilia forsythiae]QJD98917.1 hypothetical protein HH212_01765 [Massilia forsythiae]